MAPPTLPPYSYSIIHWVGKKNTYILMEFYIGAQEGEMGSILQYMFSMEPRWAPNTEREITIN